MVCTTLLSPNLLHVSVAIVGRRLTVLLVGAFVPCGYVTRPFYLLHPLICRGARGRRSAWRPTATRKGRLSNDRLTRPPPIVLIIRLRLGRR